MKQLIKPITSILFLTLCLLRTAPASSQVPVSINSHTRQHIFAYSEIQYLEDKAGRYTFAQVSSPAFNKKFKPSSTYTPVNRHSGSVCWYRISIRHNPASGQNWLLEFFDQTIDDLTLYSPGRGTAYYARYSGDRYPFNQRSYHHKNFTFSLDNSTTAERTYYIRVKSQQPVNMIVVLRPVGWFIHYALDEYFFFGLFYGMLLVFSLYNLMLFFALRQRQYLYYVVYNLSIGLYEMCTDGIAYQYLWPYAPSWNQYAYGIALFMASIFSLLFTRNLLYVKAKAPGLNRLITWVIAGRILFFAACMLFNKSWFNYKFIEIIPLTLACCTGYYIFFKGYHPARFFVVGYTFLLTGFLIKLLIVLGISWIPYGPASHYSLSFCFIMEMVFVSFANGDRVRMLKKKKDKAQKKIISQLKSNEELKDSLNRKLELQVQQRTAKVTEQAAVITAQNQELLTANAMLQAQAEEISRMNILLEQDNRDLQSSIRQVTRAHVMAEEIDFSEFSKIYPDQEACFKYLDNLKWGNGYHCRKCGHDHYFSGRIAYSRRCTRCSYEESVIANTIFQNTHIPISKAFYMVFLIYRTRGKISSHKLADILTIRQSTCWSYSSRIKKIMEERKKELRNAGEKGWNRLILEKLHKLHE